MIDFFVRKMNAQSTDNFAFLVATVDIEVQCTTEGGSDHVESSEREHKCG